MNQTTKNTSLFLVGISASSVAMAISCPAGSYGPPGATSCLEADAGFYVPTAGATAETIAPVGYYVPNTGATAAIPALAGSFVSTPGATSSEQCGPGSFTSTTGSSVCSSAPAGTYIPTVGATTAIPAPAGSFVPTSGASSAFPCSAGSFTSTAGSSTCSSSPPGTYIASSGSTAATPAPVGYYVPTSGATAATIAPPGYYVATTGATAATPAPAGTYIANSGSTSCQSCTAAEIGSYVPTSGSSKSTLVSQGFYAPSTGSINQVPAGGIAAPLTSGVQSSSMLVDMASDLYETYDPSSVKVSASYQRADVNQTGLSSGQFNSNLYAAMIQADIFKLNESTSGINFGYAYNSLKNGSAVANSGSTYQLSLFNSGSFFNGNYHGSILYGYAANSLQRNVTYSRYSSGSSVTNNETLNSSPSVSWYGLTSKLSHPIYNAWSGTAQVNFLYYSATSFNESGTASANGQAVASLTALNVSSVNYLSVPLMLGINYDIVDKGSRKFSPVVLTIGAIGDLNPTKNIQAATFDYASSLSLPVNQTSLVYGIAKLKFNGWEIAKGTRVNGVLQTLQASGASTYQAGLNLVKDW